MMKKSFSNVSGLGSLLDSAQLDTKATRIKVLPIEVFLRLLSFLPLRDLLNVCREFLIRLTLVPLQVSLWSRYYRSIFLSFPISLLAPHLSWTLDPFRLLENVVSCKTSGTAFISLFHSLASRTCQLCGSGFPKFFLSKVNVKCCETW